MISLKWTDQDYNELDKGIRDTVRFLHEKGYHTTDSGDGMSKSGIPYEDFLPFPHVVIMPEMASGMMSTAHDLWEDLQATGLDVSGVQIEATYSPVDKVATIMLMNFDDTLLSRAT